MRPLFANHASGLWHAIADGRATSITRVIGNKNMLEIPDSWWHFATQGNALSGYEALFCKKGNADLQYVFRPADLGEVLYLAEPVVDRTKELQKTTRQFKKEEALLYPYDSAFSSLPSEMVHGKVAIYDKRRVPERYARYFVIIIGWNVFRLHRLPEQFARKSGMLLVENGPPYYNYLKRTFSESEAVDSFRSLWISIYGEKSWYNNPWVVNYEFQLCDKNGRRVGG